MTKDKKFVLFCLLGLCLISPIRYFDNLDSWVVSIISHFPVQYALVSLLLLVFCVGKKAAWLGALAGILFFINVGDIIEPVKFIQASGHPEKSFTVYSANLHIYNTDLSKLRDELQEMDPEVVLLLEVVPEHRDQLRQVIKGYPYALEEEFIGTYRIGFIFLSKFPILDSNVNRLSDICNFVLEAQLEIDQRPVMFYGVHAQRPGIENFRERKDQFIRLAGHLKEQKLPLIAAGDFNSTVFSPLMRRFLKISGLRDSRVGFGWQPSWPTYVPLLWIPIDQIFLSPGIQVHNRATGSYIGSDHYPVFAELSMTD